MDYYNEVPNVDGTDVKNIFEQNSSRTHRGQYSFQQQSTQHNVVPTTLEYKETRNTSPTFELEAISSPDLSLFFFVHGSYAFHNGS